MRTERAFDATAIDHLGAGPAFWRTQHNHWPAWTRGAPLPARLMLDGFNLHHRQVQCLCHGHMHQVRVLTLHEKRGPPIAAQQLLQLLMANARQHGRVGNLVSVQVQDGQHHAVSYGVEKLVRMPSRSQRSGLGLAISDDTRHHQLRVVERRAKSMAQRIAQLAAFVDRSRRLRRGMARDSTRKRELQKQLLQARLILADVGINLAVGAFQIGVGNYRGTAVPRTRDVNHVQVVMANDAVQMHVDEVLAGRRTPVPQQHPFDIAWLQFSSKQRVVA